MKIRVALSITLISSLLLFSNSAYAQKRKPVKPTSNPPASSSQKKEQGGIYLISPKGSDGMAFEDGFIKIQFLLASQLAFEITNKRAEPIEILWDSASIVDLKSQAHRVLHAGVRYIQRDQPMPPTVIPPNAKMSDGVIPSDYVSYESSNWQVKSFLEIILDSGGQTFSLFLPMKINGVTKNYNFVFKLSREKEESQKPILIQRSQFKIQTITKSEFGSEWPFSFDETQLACANDYTFILHGGAVYLLNKTRAVIMVDAKLVETNLEPIKNENAKAGTVDFTVTFRRSAALCKQ